jgi:hypothetical protein
MQTNKHNDLTIIPIEIKRGNFKDFTVVLLHPMKIEDKKPKMKR